MNIFQITKGATKFTEDQMAVLMDVLRRYSQTDDGKWLHDIDYEGIAYKWSPAMEDSYVQAACPLIGKSIYTMPRGESPGYWVLLISPAIVHELRHKWQRKHGIIKYLVCSIMSRIALLISEDLYMKVPTEKDAFNQQDITERFINRI